MVGHAEALMVSATTPVDARRGRFRSGVVRNHVSVQALVLPLLDLSSAINRLMNNLSLMGEVSGRRIALTMLCRFHQVLAERVRSMVSVLLDCLGNHRL